MSWLNRCNIIQLPLSFGPSTTKIQQFCLYDGANAAYSFRNPYFTEFTSLTRLVIGSSNLEPFDTSIVPLNMEMFRVDYSKSFTFPDVRRHTKLSTLTAVGNFISTIPQTHIDTLSALTKFRASRNNLKGFPIFSHMKELHHLEICYNNITTMPY